MKKIRILLCGTLFFVIGGCAHSPGNGGATGWKTGTAPGKKVVASSIDDFEKQAIRLCPLGYDIMEEPLSFGESRKITRIIRCRFQR